MKTRIVIASAALLLTSLNASAKALTVDADDSQFLLRLGFKDQSAVIEETLKRNDLTQSTRMVLENNQEVYEVLNLSRDMSLKIYDAIKDTLNNPLVRKRAARLTAHLLKPHALLTDEQLPAKIKSITKSEEFSKAREEYLTQLAMQRFEAERSKLLETIVDLVMTSQKVSGQDTYTVDDVVNDFQDDVDSYLRVKFEHLELQNTPYWGRAMVALLVRHDRLHNQHEITSDLQFVLSRQKDWLENYITPEQHLRNSKGKVQLVTLHSGDFANEYSHGTEAFYITIGVKPGDRENKKLAGKSDLMGRLWQVAMYPTPTEEEQIVAKLRSGQKLTSSEKRKFARMKKAVSTAGYSHVGIVDVKEDQQSGIKMPWIWDIYPNSSLGGIRFIAPEGFAFQERFQKVGYVRYDSAKFMKYYKDTIAKRGYQENVWKSYESKVNDSGEIASDLSRETWIKTLVSEDDVKRLASYPLDQSEAWYQNIIIPRVLNMMERYLTSEEAMGFASGFANAKGAAYCSQALVLAYLQAVDVDPQQIEDKWSDFLLLTKKFNLDAASYFDLSRRIISPSGFAWQANLVAEQSTVLLDSEHRRASVYDINLDLLGADAHIEQQVSALIKKSPEQISPVVDDDDL